jgi:hypothetical protein
LGGDLGKPMTEFAPVIEVHIGEIVSTHEWDESHCSERRDNEVRSCGLMPCAEHLDNLLRLILKENNEFGR